MITGAKGLSDRSTFAVQTNNSIESILRKAGVKAWLETCGPTSCENALRVLGVDVDKAWPGGWVAQFSDIITLFLNDPRNVAAEAAVRNIDPNQYLDNEIPQFYPLAVKAVMGIDAVEYRDSVPWDAVVQEVSVGHAVMKCLVNPGHYLCFMGYDSDTSELLYRDPWPERTGTDGFNLRMGRGEFDGNTKSFGIIFRD